MNRHVGGYHHQVDLNFARGIVERAYREERGFKPRLETIDAFVPISIAMMKKSGLFKKKKSKAAYDIAKKHHISVFNNAQVKILRQFMRHLPADLGKDATIIMIEAWSVADSAHDFIRDMATVLGSCKGDVMRVMPGWCETVLKRLQKVKGFEADDMPESHAFPSDWKSRNPAELISTIFRGTPFGDLINMRVPITISSKAFCCMAHGIAEIGSGKTTFTSAVILASMGRQGVLVFDSKGGLADDLVRNSGRPDLIVKINMTDPFMRPLFNVVQAPPGTIADRAAHSIAFVLAGMGIHITDLQMPTFEMIMRIVAMHDQPTVQVLLDVIDNEERARFLVENADSDTKRWFTSQYGTEETKTALRQVSRKLWSLKSAPMRAELLGSTRNTLKLAELLDARKTVIFTMDKDKVGGDVALMMRLGLAAMNGALWSRPPTPPASSPDWRIFIDEYGDVEGETSDQIICDAITQGRQRRVGIWLTHQQIQGQLSQKVEGVLLANAAIRFARNPFEKDATKLASGMNCKPQQLQGIEEHPDEGRFMLFIRGYIKHAAMAFVPFGHLQKRKGLSPKANNIVMNGFRKYWAECNAEPEPKQRIVTADDAENGDNALLVDDPTKGRVVRWRPGKDNKGMKNDG